MKKILVADDEGPISHSLSFMLNKEGYDCVIANDRKDAIQVVKRKKPDLVLLDIDMPKKDGYHACHEIRRELGNRTHIIMLTAKGQYVEKKALKSVRTNLS